MQKNTENIVFVVFKLTNIKQGKNKSLLPFLSYSEPLLEIKSYLSFSSLKATPF